MFCVLLGAAIIGDGLYGRGKEFGENAGKEKAGF
jgi:hypothetical protein